MATSCGNKIVEAPGEKKISTCTTAADIHATISLDLKNKYFREGAEFIFIYLNTYCNIYNYDDDDNKGDDYDVKNNSINDGTT